MAKKKQKQKKQQQRKLSPENYIRKRSRELPIQSCLINSNWKQNRIALILIARKHANENLTFCVYNIDLACLGITETTYKFNSTTFEADYFIEEISEQFDIEEVDYELAHNIIYGAWEYAEDLGFQPHKDFLNITQYFLEKDTDDVELIDIEFGLDGKPHYIQSLNHSTNKANSIIKQLEKTVGKDNFTYALLDDDKDFDDIFIDDFDEDYDDNFEFDDVEDFDYSENLDFYKFDEDEFINTYSKMSSEELQEKFKAFSEQGTNGKLDFLLEHPQSMLSLINAFYFHGIDENVVAELKNQIAENLPKTTKEIIPELVGNLELNTHDTKLIQELIDDYFLEPLDERVIKKLLKKQPGNPLLYFFELLELTTKQTSKARKRITEIQKLFPNYSLIKIINIIIKAQTNDNAFLREDKLDFVEYQKMIFGERTLVNEIECFEFFRLVSLIAAIQNNRELIFAIRSTLNHNQLSENLQFLVNKEITDRIFNLLEDTILENSQKEPYKEEKPREMETKHHKNQSAVTFIFKIKIRGITNPPVWRRIAIPANQTFKDLHNAIQAAFGWEDYHLYQFSEKGYGSPTIITEPQQDDWGGRSEELNASEVILAQIFRNEKQKYSYIYDFGDDWYHEIVLEEIDSEPTMYPNLLAGKGKCPPEDCGGVWGYENLKITLSDPKNPEYGEMAEWLGLDEGEIWNPNEFDLKKAQEVFMKMVR